MTHKIDLVLVGCGKEKLVSVDQPVLARHLYTGPLFTARYESVVASNRPWMILSALHGVLHPDEKILPYDVTIADLKGEKRILWQQKVRTSLFRYFSHCDPPSRNDTLGKTIQLHAGTDYFNALNEALCGLGIEVQQAMQGKGIGEQIKAYKTFSLSENNEKSSMKLTIPRIELVKAIAAVKTVATGTATMPILANLLLVANEKSITLTGCDLDLNLRVKVGATVAETGARPAGPVHQPDRRHVCPATALAVHPAGRLGHPRLLHQPRNQPRHPAAHQMKQRANWQTYHRTGEQFARLLSPHDSFKKIGDHLGCTKQKAYHEAMVALGKLVYRLRKIIPENNQ